MSRAVYKDIKEIAEANKAAGYHFFDADAMQFFHSRVLPKVYGGRFFVTSECREPEPYLGFDGEIRPATPRCYSVREVQDDASMDTVGAFNVLSKDQAQLAAEILAVEDVAS